jgi:hypothetical protein
MELHHRCTGKQFNEDAPKQGVQVNRELANNLAALATDFGLAGPRETGTGVALMAGILTAQAAATAPTAREYVHRQLQPLPVEDIELPIPAEFFWAAVEESWDNRESSRAAALAAVGVALGEKE